MNTIDTLVLVGGISSASINQRLFNEIKKHYKGNLVFKAFDISTLPFFSQDIENNPPEAAKNFKELIKNSKAVLLITPEYNRSFPGVLKNAIDWGSRPWGHNSWNNKPVAIIGASVGPIGAFGAQQHLRNVCCYLGMHVMCQPEFYFNASVYMPESGLVENSVSMVQKYFDSFESWIKMFV